MFNVYRRYSEVNKTQDKLSWTRWNPAEAVMERAGVCLCVCLELHGLQLSRGIWAETHSESLWKYVTVGGDSDIWMSSVVFFTSHDTEHRHTQTETETRPENTFTCDWQETFRHTSPAGRYELNLTSLHDNFMVL